MRWKAELRYLLPALLLNPLLYWHGYNCWFQQDDFAWLGLRQMWAGGESLARLLFEPMAQGTIRPISERGFFLLFRWLFDLNAAPYHALVFITQTANLILLYSLVRRLGGSAVAAMLATLLWCSSNVLAWPLSWVSAYNQILISTCLLGAVAAFARYGETGRRHWLALTWLIYLFGFGVLELNVVLPGLLILYALIWARHTWRAAALTLVPAVAFAIVHSLMAQKAATGTYAMSLRQVPATLLQYWLLAVWPAETRLFTGLPDWLGLIPALVVAGVIGWTLWRGSKMALFGVGWFLVTLSLYLLLPNHVSDYYLTVPVIGLAIALAGSRVAVAVVMLLLLAPVSWVVTWKFTQRAQERSTAWESILDGVSQVAAANRGKDIYLEGIGADLFVHGMADNPFRLIGLTKVKLTPHEAGEIDISGWLDSIAPFTSPAEAVLQSLDSGSGVVFRFEGDRLRHTTPSYAERLRTSKLVEAAPSRVEVGNPVFEYLLGSGWFQPQDGYRWMGKSARLRIGAATTGTKLHVRGFCAPAQLAQGPLHLKLTPGEGAASTNFTIDSCAGSFELALALPAALLGRPRFEVLLELDRAAPVPPDKRELGVAIESVEVR